MNKIKILALICIPCLIFALCSCNKVKHEHTYSEIWEYDENYHWQIPTCGDTDEIANKSVHNIIDGVCHLCGYRPGGFTEADFYDVTYAVDGEGGTIEGQKTQRVANGGDASPVEAVPDEGYLFVMWSDGEIASQRHDKKISKNLNLRASFMLDPENSDIDDNENYGNDDPQEEPDEIKKGKTVEIDGLIYTELKDFTGTDVIGYSVMAGGKLNRLNVTIQEKIEGSPVTTIEDKAFSDQTFNTITIPETITKIGHQAFMNCTNLQNITIPDSVLDTGSQTFQNCVSLKSVMLSKNMTGIWYKMFFGCRSLSSVTLPDSIESLGRYAFYNCSSMTEVNFGSGIKKCGAKAFQGCSSLQKVNVKSLKTWCETTFDFFQFSLSSSFDSNPLYIAKNLYLNNELVENAVIPEGTTEVTSFSFYNCTSIKTVKFPSSMRMMGESVFCNCPNLESVEFEEGLVTAGYYLFFKCPKLKEIKFPDSLTTIGVDNLTLETLVTKVIDNCQGLSKITIGKGLEKIDCILATNCENLNEIDYNGTAENWRTLLVQKLWLSICADTMTVHCAESDETIFYRLQYVVENYTKLYLYVEQ